MSQRVLLRFCGVWGKRHIACMNSWVKTMLGEEEVIWKIFQVSKFPHSLAPGICPFSITSGNTVPAVHTHSWLLFCPVEHQQTFTKSALAPFGVCVSILPSWWDLLFPSHLSPHQDLLCARSQHHTGLLSMDCLYWPQIIPSLCLPPFCIRCPARSLPTAAIQMLDDGLPLSSWLPQMTLDTSSTHLCFWGKTD